jgi:hypothetical protein
MLSYYDKKTFKNRKIHWSVVLITLLLTFLFGHLTGGYVVLKKQIVVKQEIINVLEDTTDYNTFSEKNLKHLIKVLNIQHPDIVYAQAILESGNFQSELFLRNNNLFGMGVPSNRRMLTVDTKGKFSDYKANHLEGWQLSVIDYALWQDTYAHFLEREQYLDYLGSVYAEDPFYVTKIIKIVENYEN